MSFWKKIGLVVAFSAAVLGAAHALAHPKSEHACAMPTQPLPATDLNRLEVAVVAVKFGSGESSTVHGDPCPALGWVAQGAPKMFVWNDSQIP
jgi:hypothetical protein